MFSSDELNASLKIVRSRQSEGRLRRKILGMRSERSAKAYAAGRRVSQTPVRGSAMRGEEERMETKMRKQVDGVDFATVVNAVDGGMANVGSYLKEELDNFLRGKGIAEVPHVLMATHSMGGRSWTLEEGRKPVFFEEKCFNGGWYVLTEEDVSHLYCESATSGSSLTAEKKENSSWTVILEVPVVGDDGSPYQGFYWGCFHKALGQEDMVTTPQSDRTKVLVFVLHHLICTSPHCGGCKDEACAFCVAQKALGDEWVRHVAVCHDCRIITAV